MDLSCKTTQYIALIAGIAAVVFFLFSLSHPGEALPQTEKETTKNITYATTTVTIGSTTIIADIADTPQKRTLGLSGRTHMEADRGMLFVFPNENPRSFWMKDMHFPIDIVWINKEKRVVGTTRNATPDSYPRSFSPLKPAQYVLETNEGVMSDISLDTPVLFSL